MKNTKDIIYFMRLPVLFILIAVVGTYLILMANGYIFNLEARKIEQTGMIYLKTTPKNVSVYLNGVWKADKTPLKLPELGRGRYDIKVAKDKYYDWNKTFNVEEGFVNSDENIVLFLQSPIEYSASNDEKAAFEKLPSNLLNNNLEVRELSEIWIKSIAGNEEDILVTRLSEPVIKVAYYSDKKHILFQIKNEIRVIDIDGTNNIKLVTLPTNDSVIFFVDDSGQFLFYKIENDLKKIQIH